MSLWLRTTGARKLRRDSTDVERRPLRAPHEAGPPWKVSRQHPIAHNFGNFAWGALANQMIDRKIGVQPRMGYRTMDTPISSAKSGHVVTLNAGSSSIKCALFDIAGDSPRMLAVGEAELVGNQRHIVVHDGAGSTLHEERWNADGSFHTDALRRIIAWRGTVFPSTDIAGVGHRVVHGGLRFVHPVIVTDSVLAEIRALSPLAPLHQPHNIAGIEAAREAWPGAVQAACFDTAFHRAHPFVDDVFALPRHYYDEGVRRYGFHGLSYEYLTRRLREIAPEIADGRVVLAHLGNGASICAIRQGRSVASTMGFTALDGLPMGTRCGQLDPGVILYLMQQQQMNAEAIADLLYNRSGLRGLSGLSHDMRELEASDQPEAAQAIDYFVFRIRRELGGMAAVLNGLDAVVFAGGIGEHAWRIRARVLQDMEWIGIELDAEANRASAQLISSARSRVRVFVVPTNEEEMIARHTIALLKDGLRVGA